MEQKRVVKEKNKQEMLISTLQQIQDEHGYLSRENIIAIARELGIPASRVYGVATFYNQFRLKPLGKYHILVCRGTACHIKGSQLVLDKLVRELKIQPGETTKDGLFSLEVVACIGACGLAPVIAVNDHYYGGVTPEQISKIIKDYRNEEKTSEKQ